MLTLYCVIAPPEYHITVGKAYEIIEYRCASGQWPATVRLVTDSGFVGTLDAKLFSGIPPAANTEARKKLLDALAIPVGEAKSVQTQPTGKRSTDPNTATGTAKDNKYEKAVVDILSGLYQGQGYTGKQIATLTGHPLNCITPRFAPLRRKGKIKDSGQRRDRQIVWVLA